MKSGNCFSVNLGWPVWFYFTSSHVGTLSSILLFQVGQKIFLSKLPGIQLGAEVIDIDWALLHQSPTKCVGEMSKSPLNSPTEVHIGVILTSPLITATCDYYLWQLRSVSTCTLFHCRLKPAVSGILSIMKWSNQLIFSCQVRLSIPSIEN